MPGDHDMGAVSPDEVLSAFPGAVARGELFPVYQAQHDCLTGRIVGAEALMRWAHPSLGTLAPGSFIPALEAAGMVVEADLALLDQVCAFCRGCADAGVRMPPISFNVSRADLADPGWLGRAEATRLRHGVPVGALRAEVTETMPSDDMAMLAGAVGALRRLGYMVEMDDFGAGHSSAALLMEVPFDALKLDMSLLQAEPDGRGRVVVGSIVEMAGRLGMPVIAEGVETRGQEDFLTGIGCRYAQGFLFSSPCGGDELAGAVAAAGVGELRAFRRALPPGMSPRG